MAISFSRGSKMASSSFCLLLAVLCLNTKSSSWNTAGEQRNRIASDSLPPWSCSGTARIFSGTSSAGSAATGACSCASAAAVKRASASGSEAQKNREKVAGCY